MNLKIDELVKKGDGKQRKETNQDTDRSMTSRGGETNISGISIES